jgi:CubicO group peptidase (beta-lactamase class C family)
MNITKPKTLSKTNPGLVSLAILLVLLFAFPSSASDQTHQDIVDEYFNAYVKIGKFSGVVLIAKDGEILVNKGYGLANREHDVPNTPQTKFRLGSMTKQFTAAAIMQLQEQGKLNVEDSIDTYIPDYPNGDRITLHHLLTHTSGIPNLTDFPDHRKTIMIPSPVEKTILRFTDKPLEFTPGEQFKYSNSGYLLLGYVIEKISGKTYEDYLEENIFHPLNMENSGYDHHSTILKNRATGYHLTKDGLINAPYVAMSMPHAGGALYSTVEDLFLWDRALYTENILKKSSLENMFTPFKGNYGYGWRIDSVFGHKRIHHGGSILGFQTHIARYVGDNTLVVFLCNQRPINTKKISEDLAAIVFGEAYELPTDDKTAGKDEEKKKK